MHASITSQFKNVLTESGKYTLYFKANNKYAVWERVTSALTSQTPFEFIQTFPRSQMIALARRNSFGKNIFLIDSRTGNIPQEIQYGSDFIEYDARNGAFYFSPVLKDRIACFKWRISNDSKNPTRMRHTPTIDPLERYTCSRCNTGLSFSIMPTNVMRAHRKKSKQNQELSPLQIQVQQMLAQKQY